MTSRLHFIVYNGGFLPDKLEHTLMKQEETTAKEGMSFLSHAREEEADMNSTVGVPLTYEDPTILTSRNMGW